MGTRADFYIGRGESAEWLGSVAFDGYPDGIKLKEGEWPSGRHLFDATTEAEFRERLTCYFKSRRDVTVPSDGWPWPWEDSQTTDYAYAFDGGRVHASSFGHEWFDPMQPESEMENNGKTATFPNMKARQNVAFGKRSGIIILGGGP